MSGNLISWDAVGIQGNMMVTGSVEVAWIQELDCTESNLAYLTPTGKSQEAT
jgi:hypothetical protein